MSSLPGAAASRSPFIRSVSVAPTRDKTPTTAPTPSSKKSGAAPFSALLGAILATNGATRTAAGLPADIDNAAEGAVGSSTGSSPDDLLTLLDSASGDLSATSGAGEMSEAELQAAGIFAAKMGAAGLAALSGKGADNAIAESASEQGIEEAIGASSTGRVAAHSTDNSSTEATATASSSRSAATLDTIAPELRERVERVVERMRDEFGITVDVTEGYRTQARQETLHAQGRSKPGPVVTWTRNSRHTQGRAVDVMVNGGYSDTQGFATLQRVAREEGLHTLGMRDPGHLELPPSVAGSARPNAAALAGGSTVGIDIAALTQLASDAGARVESLDVDVDITPTSARVSNGSATAQHTVAQPSNGLPRVASVATVAQVANVARLARVAVPGGRASGRVSAEGEGSSARASSVSARVHSATASNNGATATAGTGVFASATDSAGSAARLAATEASALTAAPLAATQVAAANGQVSPRARARSIADEQAGETSSESSANSDRSALFGGDGRRDGGSTVAAPRMAPVTGANAADALTRIDQIDALRDGSASRPMSHLTLTMDNADGGTDRIRVDVRGSQAGAVLELSDPMLRDRVSSNLGELQKALEQRGLQSDSLQVRRAGVSATEAQDMSSRIAGATLEREGVRASSNANTGQSTTQQRERDGRQSSDGSPDDPSSRHRPRQEPKENRK